jgi:DNA-binding NarL/FixJ family response regulator
VSSTTPTEASLGPRRRRVLELRREGQSVRAIARELEMSTQRVYQHMAILRERGFLPEREEASA